MKKIINNVAKLHFVVYLLIEIYTERNFLIIFDT